MINPEQIQAIALAIGMEDKNVSSTFMIYNGGEVIDLPPRSANYTINGMLIDISSVYKVHMNHAMRQHMDTAVLYGGVLLVVPESSPAPLPGWYVYLTIAPAGKAAEVVSARIFKLINRQEDDDE
jgi:hypothetical protein